MAGAGRNREFLAGRIPWGSPGILRGASRGGLRGTGPAVAQEAQGGNLSRCARNEILFASKAPFGPVPLPLSQRSSCGRRCSQHDRSNSNRYGLRVWPIGLANVLDAWGWCTGDLEGCVSGGLRGTGPAVAQETQGGNLSRCPRDDQGVRLQGSLRLGPAVAQPTKLLRKKMQPARPIQLKSLRLKGLANRSGECFGCLRLVHRGS
jgi:hypothetical protein